MEFYCFHCDKIIPDTEVRGGEHRNCGHVAHPMALHPAYEKDAKAPLPEELAEDECPDCGEPNCQTNH